MGALALQLAALLFSSASPGVVTAYHGDRVEWVFTAPVVISANVRPLTVYSVEATAEMTSCEWLGPRLDGTEVRVCGGSVVAVRLGSDVRTVGGVR